MTFSDRLADLRKEKGFNQTYLANYMGVTQVSVSNWERGFKEPNFKMLIELANFYGVTTDYLLGVTNKRK